MTTRHCERSEAIQSRGAAAGLLRRILRSRVYPTSNKAPRNDALLVAALLGALAAPALAAPRSIAECEKIQEADAYNRCLASFGPTRGQHNVAYPGIASEVGHGGSGRGASQAQSRFGRAQVSQGRGGRMRMEFTPGRR
jgi:hypothetical protein